MAIVTGLDELSRFLDEVCSAESSIKWSVEGKEFVGWVDFAEMQIRDRVLSIALPNTPPLDPSVNLQSPDKLWFKGWQPILTAIGIFPLSADPKALRAFRETKKHICMVADTSAVAEGIIACLSRMRWHSTMELVIPIVVDSELFGWADQDKFWSRKLETWHPCVKYRLARRLSETPPKNLLVRRPPMDEMAALMLAKVKVDPGTKSPDADILLIDMAREFVRTQPVDVSVFYVTGDRNHARTATAILGAQHVLYAAPSLDIKLNAIKGLCASWQKSDGLGAVHCLSLAEILWDVLAGVDKVRICGKDVEFTVKHSFTGAGYPCDWVTPSFEVETERDDRQKNSTSATNALLVDETLLVSPEQVTIAPGRVTLPAVGAIQKKLNSGLSNSTVPNGAEASGSDQESFLLLVQIEAVNLDGSVLSESPIWEAIRNNDWDTVHREFCRAPGYLSAIEEIRSGAISENSRDKSKRLLSIARHLGQVARPNPAGGLQVGDRGVTRTEMIDFLENCLIEVGRDYAMADVLIQAMNDLGLTPARFEHALQRLIGAGYDKVTYESGGTVQSGHSETVWRFKNGEVVDMPISMGVLYLGGERPVRSLRRSQ